MRTRKPGTTDLEVPVIVLGTNVFGWTVAEPDAFRILDRAFDYGLNFLDTANSYSTWVPGNRGGESETIIGNWLARSGKRDKMILATKVGWEMGDGRMGLAPDYIMEQAEDSLRRLQTDHIDVYFAHKDDPDTPLTDTLRAFQSLVEQGKARVIGASNYTGARLREALETSRRHHLESYQVLQPLYNLLEREPYESDLAPVVQEYGLGVTPYFGLAGGFLTGKYRSESDVKNTPRGGMAAKYMNDRGRAVLEALDEVARQYRSTPARVALAWLIARPGITAPIASVSNENQLVDLVEAAALDLDQVAMEKLNAASSPVPV
jgi:aryl-alcohol dehydrogenase-like predicted oxidoreductase